MSVDRNLRDESIAGVSDEELYYANINLVAAEFSVVGGAL